MPPVNGQNLFKHEREKKSAAGTENSVVDLEKESEFLRLTCLHDLANAEDGGEVASKNAQNDWLGREGRGTTNIMGVMVGDMGDGDIFEDEIREASHDEADRKKNTRELMGFGMSLSPPQRRAPFPAGASGPVRI
jgi:hypothetical protein